MTLYVNGQVIEQTQIQAEIERMRAEYEKVFAAMDSAQREKQLIEWAKENVIEAVLLAQQANQQIGPVDAATLDEAVADIIRQHGGKEAFDAELTKNNLTETQIRQDIERQIRTRQWVEKIESQSPPPSDRQIANYYQDNLLRFTMPAMVRASHIVRHPKPDVPSERLKEQMETILVRLKAGEDFGTLAAEHSDCPERGGDLGYFAAGQMVPEFENVVFALKPGQISGVFETSFGFHIAKVIDKRPPTPVQLDQVRQVIRDELIKQSRQKTLEKTLDSLRVAAVIEDR